MERYTEEKLNKMSVHTLRVILRSEFNGVPGVCNKNELISQILDIQAGASAPPRSTKGRKPLGEFITPLREEISFSDVDEDEELVKKGVFELNADGFGFVRVNKLDGFVDFFVPKTLVKRFALQTGDKVDCIVNYVSETGSLIVKTISLVNGKNPEDKNSRIQFSHLKAKYPKEKIELKRGKNAIIDSVDAFCPIGKGQRCLVEDDAGRFGTEFANALVDCIVEKDLQIITIFAGVKPEALEDIVQTENRQYIALPINLSVEETLRIVNLAVERAKTMTAMGEHVLLVIDSLTYLVNVYEDYILSNQTSSYLKSGLTPKKYASELFGMGGNFGENSSLTIVATIDSRRDEKILGELSSISTSVIKLKGSDVVRRRGYVVDLLNSYTDKDELLLGIEEIAYADDERKQLAENEDYLASIYNNLK